MSNQNVGTVYSQIIDDVIQSSRVDFEEGGVEEAVLLELMKVSNLPNRINRCLLSPRHVSPTPCEFHQNTYHPHHLSMPSNIFAWLFCLFSIAAGRCVGWTSRAGDPFSGASLPRCLGLSRRGVEGQAFLGEGSPPVYGSFKFQPMPSPLFLNHLNDPTSPFAVLDYRHVRPLFPTP